MVGPRRRAAALTSATLLGPGSFAQTRRRLRAPSPRSTVPNMTVYRDRLLLGTRLHPGGVDDEHAGSIGWVQLTRRQRYWRTFISRTGIREVLFFLDCSVPGTRGRLGRV